MEILKIVLTVIYIIAALAIITIVLLQEGKSAGLGATFATSNQENYYSKNKGRTLEGKFERWTKITAGVFVVIAIILMII